ncbi:MAG: hypothetical protein LBP51_04720 [Deferribacteraceae bacterium]|nr:hypothetical protein [Deferribacteraceae bacterium]
MQDKTMEILAKHLDKDFRVSPMAPNRTTIDDIVEVERVLSVKFPEEYAAHLIGEGAELLGERGLFIEVKQEVWPRPKQYDVGAFWSFLYAIHTYTASKESDDWMRLEYAGEEFIRISANLS